MAYPSDRDEEDIWRSNLPAPLNFGLFADHTPPPTAAAKRDGAIRANDKRIANEKGGDALVQRVTERLRSGFQFFTADDIASILDEEGVPKDLATRRRVVSVIVNRGRGQHAWGPLGWVPSQDSRHNGRPVMQWRVNNGA